MVPSSQNPGLSKTVVTAALRVRDYFSHDHMVEEFYIDSLGRFSELASHLHIGRTRRRVSAGMIMRAGDGGGTVLDGRPKNLPRVCQ